MHYPKGWERINGRESHNLSHYLAIYLEFGGRAFALNSLQRVVEQSVDGEQIFVNLRSGVFVLKHWNRVPRSLMQLESYMAIPPNRHAFPQRGPR